MSDFPKDPAILLSWTNMKLRDFYPDIEALCDDLCIGMEELCGTLAEGGFTYDREHNRFV